MRGRGRVRAVQGAARPVAREPKAGGGKDVEEVDVLEDVQKLVEKERKWMELQLLEKEKELEALRATVKSQKGELEQGDAGELARSRVRGRRRVKGKDSFAGGDEQEEEDSATDYEDDELAESLLESLGNPVASILDGENMRSLANLTVISLRGQGINDTSLGELCSCLLHVSSVRELDLSANSLGQGAAAILAQFIVAQQRNTQPNKNSTGAAVVCKLESLNLAENRFMLEPAQSICRAAGSSHSLLHLDLSLNPFSEEQEAGRIIGQLLGSSSSAACSLESVRVTVGEAPRDRASRTARGNTAMMASCLLGGASRVTRLAMVHASLSAACVQVLATEGLQMRFLRELDLSFGFIGPQGAAVLCKAIVRACVESSKQRVPEAAASAMSARGQLVSLEKLGLRMNAIGPVGAAWVARALAASSALRDVDISSNDLTDASLGTIAQALIRNNDSALERLNLARNRFFGVGSESETGALQLVEALRLRKRLGWIGAREQLELSVRIKRLLTQVWAAGGDLARAEDTDDDPILVPRGSPEPLFENRSRRLLQDIARTGQGRPGEPARGVQVAKYRLPESLSSEVFGDYDVVSQECSLTVEWQSSPAVKWRILRESRSAALGSMVDTVQQGASTDGLVVSGAGGSWKRYAVTVDGWRASDALVLELGEISQLTLAAPVLVDKVAVRTKRSASQASVAASRMGSRRPITSFFKSEFNSNSQCAVLHLRDWSTELLFKAAQQGTSNLFTRIHSLYLHAGTRSGTLWLEWNVRIQSLEGRVVRQSDGGLAGADWRITKSGSGPESIAGPSEQCRALRVEQALPRSDQFACYAVDLTPLRCFIGDTITLDLRPPTKALPERVHQHRPQRMLALHSSCFRLVLVDGENAPGAANIASLSSQATPKFNLAGDRPFALLQSPYAWA